MPSESDFPVVVFLSHAQVDEEAAKKLADWLERTCFPGMVRVFVSSRWGSIETGVDWFERILSALKQCTVGLVLLTPNSVQRPWVNIEVGGLKLLNKKLIPICVDPTRVEDLPAPLDRQQACKYEDPISLLNFMRSIALSLGLPKEWIEQNVTKRLIHRPPRLGPIMSRDSKPLATEVGHEPAIGKLFETEDRWTTVVYTCRATFTGETCPASEGQTTLLKALSSHIPVDEVQTVCTAVNHLMPKEERAHENDILDTVICSKRALELAQQPRSSLDEGAPHFLDRDLIVIGENNLSNLLLYMMKPYLPWEKNLHWEVQHPDKPGRPMVYVQLADHALATAPPRQIKSVGKGGGMVSLFPSPFNIRKRILILFGCHREGQFALENWLRSEEVGNVVLSAAPSLKSPDGRDYAVQVVIQSGGTLPRGGALPPSWEAGTIPNLNDSDRPLWLTRLKTVAANEAFQVDLNCESQPEMYDISLLAELPPDIRLALKTKIQSKINAPELYWEDEHSEIGFHITLFEFCTHDKPTRETVGHLEELLALLSSGLRSSTLPSPVSARIRGVEAVPSGIITYVDFPVADTSYPNWLAVIRSLCERQSRRVHSVQHGYLDPLINRNRVPFPAHITLCRFKGRVDSSLGRELRQLAAQTRTEEIRQVELTSVSLAVARKRPYRDVRVAERYQLL